VVSRTPSVNDTIRVVSRTTASAVSVALALTALVLLLGRSPHASAELTMSGGSEASGARGSSSRTPAASASTKPAPCLATPVHAGGRKVRAGGFVGGIVPAYDVVEGRFRLHVGPYRDRATGLSQKIPWWTNAPSKTGTALVVVGTRLSPRPALKFTQTFRSSMRWMFPTTISPSAPGCWRLHLISGRVKGSVVARVDR
jgi:hypothetical protein